MIRAFLKKYLIIIILLLIFGIWLLFWFLITKNIATSSDRGQFGDMFGAINSLFSGLALGGIVYSLYLQIKSTNIDHERRRKEATIHYLAQIRPKYKILLQECEKNLGVDVISNDLLQVLLVDEDLRNTVKDYLSTLEHLAVGINSSVFDKDILYRMSSNYLIRMYYRFKPYIDHAQLTLPTAYIEFEQLVKEFEKTKRTLPPNIGNISN